MQRIAFLISLLSLFLAPHVASAQFRTIRTIAGNGQTAPPRAQGRALQMPLSNPFGVQPEDDDSLIIASYDQHVIYRLDPTYQRLTWIAGTGKAGFSGEDGEIPKQVAMNQPHEVQVAANGDIYVADTRNHRVGKIDARTGRWQNVAGTGQAGFGGDGDVAEKAQMNQAYSIAIDGRFLFIADLQNHRIRQVDLDSRIIETICGTGEKRMPTDGAIAKSAPLAGPRSLTVDAQNIWIVLREGNSVWRLDRRDLRLYHVAGTGEKGFSGDGGNALDATFNGPKGIAVDPGRAVYVADTENHAIRMIDLKSQKIQTIAGSPSGTRGFNGDGDAPDTRLLNRPHGVCLLSNGALLIGDSENHRVRMLEK